jgi:alginate O-acetyltransferase complex protein AlgI
MLFPTTAFAIFFLFVFAGNWLLAGRGRAWKAFMLVASYGFYGYWNWRFVGLLGASTVLNHAAALGVERSASPTGRRFWLGLAIGFNLGALAFFKYYGFFVQTTYRVCLSLGVPCSLPLLDIVLPVGISFFTFQALSYVFDVFRGELAPAESTLDFGVYLAFFPQLVAGPIVRARVLLPQVSATPDRGCVDFGRAATLILVGLFKKVVVANVLAERLVDPVFRAAGDHGAWDVLFATYGYAAQIYCDFSAYSDIAIGVALLLGFRFSNNFNAPYTAVSVRDFWQRWHISLSTWLRDYLYIPLGGSRTGAVRAMRNVMLVFLLGGLWHGAQWTFVAWGALHGIYLVAGRLFGAALARLRLAPPTGRQSGPAWRLLRACWVFHLVCFAWICFRAETFADAGALLRQLGDWRRPELATLPAALTIVLGLATQLCDGDRLAPLWDWINRRSFVLQGLLAAIILTVVMGLGPRGVAPFIYFQF